MKTLFVTSFPRLCDMVTGGAATAEDMKGMMGGLDGGSWLRLYRIWLEGMSIDCQDRGRQEYPIRSYRWSDRLRCERRLPKASFGAV